MKQALAAESASTTPRVTMVAGAKTVDCSNPGHNKTEAARRECWSGRDRTDARRSARDRKRCVTNRSARSSISRALGANDRSLRSQVRKKSEVKNFEVGQSCELCLRIFATFSIVFQLRLVAGMEAFGAVSMTMNSECGPDSQLRR